MPCPYVIDTKRRLVITTASGHLTFAEARAHQDQLKSDPGFKPDFDQLLDTTGVTILDLTADQAKILAQQSLFFSPSSRRAWIANTPFLFGMARLIQAHRELAGAQDHFCLFRDRDEALKWLGLDGHP